MSVPVISVINQSRGWLLLCNSGVSKLLRPGEGAQMQSKQVQLLVRTFSGEWALAQCVSGAGVVSVGTTALQQLRRKATLIARRMTTPS